MKTDTTNPTKRRRTERVFVWMDDDLGGIVKRVAAEMFERNESAAARYLMRRGAQALEAQQRDPVPFETQG